MIYIFRMLLFMLLIKPESSEYVWSPVSSGYQMMQQSHGHSSVWVSVFPVCSCHRRREGSKTAVLTLILWECSWVEENNLYNLPRQEKLYSEIQLFLNITDCVDKNGKIEPERDHPCTFLDKINQLGNTNLGKASISYFLVHAEWFGCF